MSTSTVPCERGPNIVYQHPVFDVDYEKIDAVVIDGVRFERAERTCEAVDNGGYSFRFECSACGYMSIVHNCSVRLDELPNYCPNCGAKVVGTWKN